MARPGQPAAVPAERETQAGTDQDFWRFDVSFNLTTINWLAVMVAAFTTFMFGGAWYTTLFGKARSPITCPRTPLGRDFSLMFPIRSRSAWAPAPCWPRGGSRRRLLAKTHPNQGNHP